ncbi:MAG: Plasmid pRiA4b ORF-3-like protein [Chloroflexi bacterium]|nr:Plasmid pRiA4b ORF-3-like protein [Chloroflexota bacterium]
MARTSADAKPIYQLKVTLHGIRPPIWRRIQVRAGITLPRLHDTIQAIMGWDDEHLHQFIIGGEAYGLPDPDLGGDMRSERRVKLEQVVTTEKDRFVYEYDFGDSWTHVILLEKIVPPEPGGYYPRCLAGKRACPPEDVGGIWGYAEFLDAIGDSNHPEHEEMLEWWGGDFDPEAFSLEEINQALGGRRLPQQSRREFRWEFS